MKPGTAFQLEVTPKIPERLARLEELANNLWYSWDIMPTRALFSRLDPGLWNAVGHSPKALLKRIDQHHLVNAAEDKLFLDNYKRVLSAYDSYHGEQTSRDAAEVPLARSELVAYFCFEFGFHESLPIYSGGLGILAGDHCKTASDMRLPFVGVGLLYRQGYFFQTIDGQGHQRATYVDSDFDDLPITPVLREDGSELKVTIEFPGREVKAKVWQARVGCVNLYLLDTDIDENTVQDRNIAHQLYGGDRTTRIEQELVLGIGGVRALAAMGLTPTVWHINEGHAAFMILERLRSKMRLGLDFASALEAVAVNTVFTTHTPVPAGHDHFSTQMLLHYFQGCCDELNVPAEKFLALGMEPGATEFNMTTLAVRGSRFHNGVSKIHGDVSARILGSLWPQIPPQENPITAITNGVHVPTFLSPEWADAFDHFLGYGWSRRLGDQDCWDQISAVPDHVFWSTRQHLKSQLLHLVRYRIREQNARNQGSEAHLDRLLGLCDPDNPTVLIIGFGRRFATYNRATLLFENLVWLSQLLGDPKRPVLFLFAGKAHPADVPGQELIRRVTEVSQMPEFEGKILLVEGYDLRLSRRMVSGVDVWLNNPVYPLEASGTSGMKAAINGVVNLSVLDGWWGEGYDGSNGWAIKPSVAGTADASRNREEARTLYEILQDHVIPLYYKRESCGYSLDWVKLAKRSISSLMPRFNSMRMLGEYVANCYRPAAQQGRLFAENRFEVARSIAAWKSRVRQAWPGVTIRRLDVPKSRIEFGDGLRIELAISLNNLQPEDLAVELLVSRHGAQGSEEMVRHRFVAQGAVGDGEHRFVLELAPEWCGRLDMRIRAYPCHEYLTHPLELGLMLWA
ncbi:MAG: alpha-glucan family phosphorylase [Burkholderiales bacterium]|nr:alpha-glucan family phosphorylase [Burkholderiales bacterium]